jgi:Dolichyl-phosphate-mannose-protein mannosyltransferase
MPTELASEATIPDDARRAPTVALLERARPTWILGAIVVVVTAVDVLWRTRERRPPHGDMAFHLTSSLIYLRNFSVTDPLQFAERYLYYPPLVYWVADVFYAVLGNEAMWVAVLSNAVWIAILVFATYGIGSRLWNPRVGLLSVAFVVTAPMLVTSFKEYMLDAPLTAAVALALYFLIRADGFFNRRYSLLFGLACGCGLLVKWTFPLLLWLPSVHATAMALSEARQKRRFHGLVNLAGAAVVAFAVAGTWYARNLNDLATLLPFYLGQEGVPAGAEHVTSLTSIVWYLWNLVNDQLYVVPFLFVLAGIAFLFVKRGLAARNLFPVLTVVGTYVAFTLLRHKDPRFTLPMLPALAVIATSWLEYVSVRARNILASTLVVYGVVAFVGISFGTSLLPRDTRVDLGASASFLPEKVTIFAQTGDLIGPPTRENWHQVDSFKTMARVPPDQRTFTYQGQDTTWLNANGFAYYALRYGARMVTASGARFIINRGLQPATPSNSLLMRLHRWRLPDGDTLALYERE